MEDAAGNSAGRFEGERRGLPALLLGSHLDTVPDAGRYDGMLGVLLAIEVADRIERRRRCRSRSRCSPSATRRARASAPRCSGRAPFAGTVGDAWLATPDRKGVTLAQAFVDSASTPRASPTRPGARTTSSATSRPTSSRARTCSRPDRPLGVVTSIAGARRFALQLTGRAGHAGGTPYARRHDALVGAAEIVVAIERISIETPHDRHGRPASARSPAGST